MYLATCHKELPVSLCQIFAEIPVICQDTSTPSAIIHPPPPKKLWFTKQTLQCFLVQWCSVIFQILPDWLMAFTHTSYVSHQIAVTYGITMTDIWMQLQCCGICKTHKLYLESLMKGLICKQLCLYVCKVYTNFWCGPCTVKLRFTVLWALQDICFNILLLVLPDNSVVLVNSVCHIFLPFSPPYPFLVATSNRKHFPWSHIKKSTRSTNGLNCTFNVMVFIFCISCMCFFTIKEPLRE